MSARRTGALLAPRHRGDAARASAGRSAHLVMKRRSGLALIDFIAGTVILAGAVTSWAAITRVQFESVSHVDRRLQARNAAARVLAEVRAEGAAPIDSRAPADAQGWRLLRTFEVPGLPPLGKEPVGRLEVRPLAADRPGGAPAASVGEVRAVIRWRARKDYDELELSSAVGERRP